MRSDRSYRRSGGSYEEHRNVHDVVTPPSGKAVKSTRCMLWALRPFLLLLASGGIIIPAYPQAGVATVGIQVKPVVPLSFFDPVVPLEKGALRGHVTLTGGYAFGMSVRVGLTNTISLETGILQIQRNYRYALLNDTSGYADSAAFRYVGYEIPLTALANIRLGERMWMNAAIGFSLDAYPSDVQKDVERGRIYVYRNNWAQFGALANLGVEYRSERSGYFYLGGSFHRPFGSIAVADLTYYGPTFFPYTVRGELDGGYLTLDVRYYFHEDPDRTRVRRR
jgi:hypothetical protein